MPIKVAIASSDGKFINRHFGHTKEFLIFEVGNENFKFVELRVNEPPCLGKEHHDNRLARSVELIADCQVVLASQIGPGAAETLVTKGIQPFVCPDFIDDALKKLITWKE